MFPAPLVSFWCRLSTWCRPILVDFGRLFVDFCRHHVDTKICVETQSRHRFLCRHDVDIKIHDFCRFLSMVCWFDVDFGRSHVVDMCRTYIRQKSTSHILNIDKKRQKSWILMSTSSRHKNLCRYHVDMKFHGFCRFLSMLCWFLLSWCSTQVNDVGWIKPNFRVWHQFI